MKWESNHQEPTSKIRSNHQHDWKIIGDQHKGRRWKPENLFITVLPAVLCRCLSNQTTMQYLGRSSFSFFVAQFQNVLVCRGVNWRNKPAVVVWPQNLLVLSQNQNDANERAFIITILSDEKSMPRLSHMGSKGDGKICYRCTEQRGFDSMR